MSTLSAIQKLGAIKNYLSTKFVERDEIIYSLLIALLAKQHILLIGLPGTAKSDLIGSLVKQILGANYFQLLFTKYTTPEEVFGPLSLKELEQEKFIRRTENFLPAAHLSFLDEIFKANSAILNSLLNIINERVFYQNGQVVYTPLHSVIGASNEYPENDESLSALFDRFLIRHEVGYIAEDNNFLTMLRGVDVIAPEALTLAELVELQQQVDSVKIADEILHKILKIRKELLDKEIAPSDRRFKKSLSLIKAAAVLDGRDQVTDSDLAVLANVLWEDPKHQKDVGAILAPYTVDAIGGQLDKLSKQAKSVYEDAKAKSEITVEETKEVNKKFKSIIEQLRNIESHNPTKKGRIDQMVTVIREWNNEIVNASLGV